jgi:AcrR family transcriptional regulator
MPRPRFANLPPHARARLLRVATKHFARRGLEGASLNEILAEAGISKGAYYYYFDDKDDLLATVMEGAIDTMLARLPTPEFDTLTREGFWPTVERFVADWAATWDLSGDLMQVAAQFTEAQRRNERFAPIVAKMQTFYRMLIEPGQRLGCVRTDLPADALVRLLEANDTALDSLFLSLHSKVTRESVDLHMQLVFDTFKRLLIADASAGKPSPGRGRTRRRR